MGNSVSRAAEKAKNYFDTGFNCAESSLLAIIEELGPASECAPRIATGFGAGFGRRGEVCGAISGAIMAISLNFGRTSKEDKATKEKVYLLAQEFTKRFEESYESLLCRDLTECDMMTPEGMKKFEDLKIHKEKCTHFVSKAVEIAGDIIERERNK